MNNTKKKGIGTQAGIVTITTAIVAVIMILTSIIMPSCTTMNTAAGISQQAKATTGVRESLDSRTYTIDVETAYPQRGRMISLTGVYELKVDGDNVTSRLPYFGRAYRATFGTGSPLDFSGRIMNYKQELTRKNITRINFDSKNEDDLINYRIEVSDDGRATIYVTSRYRERISFDGELGENAE